jgi:glycogen(starch) synthase
VRVLIVSWEFPPLVVGGLGRHVFDLSRELAALGHEVCVLTRGATSEHVTEVFGEVRVIRAAVDDLAVDFTTESLLAWTQVFEHSLVRAGIDLVTRWTPDVIHAHDWLVAQTAHTLSRLSHAPVVATVHAIEYGRQQGWLAEPLHRAIHSVERWLCRNADAVITCSTFMADEVSRLFQLDRSSVHVIGNGIDPQIWSSEPAGIPRQDGPLLAFAGRFVHEKGIQELIKALPLLRTEYPDLCLVLAGSGHERAEQQDRARRYEVADLIDWPGFLDDESLAALFRTADVVVVPSLYEPFGLVALEAQAVGTPVAVADTGGLRDLVQAGITGERFEPQNPTAIAEAVRRLLQDPQRAQAMAISAQRRAHKLYSWQAVANSVADVYASIQTPSRRAV